MFSKTVRAPIDCGELVGPYDAFAWRADEVFTQHRRQKHVRRIATIALGVVLTGLLLGTDVTSQTLRLSGIVAAFIVG